MKRWIVVLLVALAIVVLISPGLIGRLAERNLDEGLARLDLDSEDIDIRTESYDRGWFSSAGRHRIDLKRGWLVDLLGGSEAALVLDTRLDHGLVPVASMQRESGSFRPALANAVSTVSLAADNGETYGLPGHIYTFVGLGGSATYRFLMEPGEYETDNAGAKWQSVDVVVTDSPDGRRREFEGTIEAGLASSIDDAETTVGDLSFSGFVDRSRHAAGDRQLALDLASIRVSVPGNETMVFGPVRVEAEQDVDGNDVDGSLSVEFAADDLPEFGSMTAKLALDYEDLDADMVAQLIETWRQTASLLDDLGEPTGPGAAGYAMPALDSQLKRLIGGGGRFNVAELSMSLPQGDWSMSLTVEADGAEDAVPAWPTLLMNADARIEARISSGLFEHMRALNPELETAVAGGFLTPTTDGYELGAEMKDGRLTINGAPLPIDALLGRPQSRGPR